MNLHAYDCRCVQCRAMVEAIAAQAPDGEPFFSDAEIQTLADAFAEWCGCAACTELRASLDPDDYCNTVEERS